VLSDRKNAKNTVFEHFLPLQQAPRENYESAVQAKHMFLSVLKQLAHNPEKFK